MLSLLLAQAALPQVIVPQGKPTFQEAFRHLDVSPDKRPGHRWLVETSGSIGSANWTPAALDAAGGKLTITASRTGAGWSSGSINTRYSFGQLHGYFEVTADLPTCTKGAFPAFWLLPVSGGGWPKNGEIDTPEAVGDGGLYWSTHSGAEAAVTQKTAGDCTRASHRYGALWRADRIGFYYDRKLVASKATPADFTLPMYLIVNLGMEGGWAGKTAPELNRVQMTVTNVTAWPAQ